MRFWKESNTEAVTRRSRDRMVSKHLLGRGLTCPRLLEAFSEVPREEFVPSGLKEWAYADRPLGIGFGQTISQPYIVALTVDKLRLTPEDSVLEVGTGSGYAAAILSRLAARVITIERLPELADSARERLRKLGYQNVTVVCADGTQGYPAQAPYDAIAVAAGGPQVPPSLKEQLAVGGRLVIPVGDEGEQSLLRVTRIDAETFFQEQLCKVRFVPLVGQDGWQPATHER